MSKSYTCICCEKVFNDQSNKIKHQKKCIENKKIEDEKQAEIQRIANEKTAEAAAKLQAIENKAQEKEAKILAKDKEKALEKAEKKAKAETKEQELKIEKAEKKAKAEAKEAEKEQEKQAKLEAKQEKATATEEAKKIKIIDYLDFNWDTVKELFKKKSLADYFKDGKDTFFSRILKTIFSNPEYRCIRLNKERTNIDNYFEIHTMINKPILPNKADFDTFELYKVAKQKYYIEMSMYDEQENMGWTDTLYDEPVGGQSFFDVLHQMYCEGEPTDGAIKRFEYTFIISGKNNNTFKSFIGDIITGVDIKAT